MAGFQTAVNANPAPGLEGGFCSDNDHFTALTPGNGDPTLANYSAWTAGAAGLILGRFGFGNLLTGQISSVHPGIVATNVRVGFVHRYQPALITAWLGQSSMILQAGLEADMVDAGDFWCRFAAGAAIGQKVYAYYADGSAYAAATATPPTTSFNVTTVNGSPNLTGVAGTLVPGQPISGTGIAAGAYVVSFNATAQTAVLSANSSAAATVSATVTTAYETRFSVNSLAAAGELAKISTRG